MRFNYLLGIAGVVLMYIGLVMLIPIVVALIFKEFSMISAFLIPAIACAIIGFLFRFLADRISNIENFNDIKKSEGLFTVVMTWLLMGGVASIPYMLMGFSPINALFESASGITTTGATILTHFDYTNTLFFWRAFTQWQNSNK